MQEWKANIRLADIVGAVLTLIVCIVGWLITTTWIPPILPGDPGAAFFPRIAMGIMAVFAILLLIQHFAKAKKASREHAEDSSSVDSVSIDLYQLFVALSFSGAVVAGMHYIGFEAATFLFLFILLGWRTGRWVWALLTAVFSTALMYLIFVTVLKVRLPLMFLPKYLTIQDILSFLNPF